ncbi:thiamine phosphate synthase [Bombilactobacillus thymidiniphilus]|uniref:Thiamine-phosphate synthase n=1 Tax=Bombilactobacillus thymidiniphilus TaxID=2923363 RepID=A0ABY4PFR5_9LACO|nr:thiamine phosphate synthase [Bombilactobacillus thymidiniphilus]UQS84376.1 thiamine phosphate synthase [Bombilactobacillus thymidiniphilus]
MKTQSFNPDVLKAYFVCGTQDLTPQQSLIVIVQQALKAGITAYQFRDKGPHAMLSHQQRLEEAFKLKQLCHQYQVPFIVDDDVTLAQQINADGVHVGQSDAKIQQVVTKVGSKMIVGLSCSNKQEIEIANQITGIDYYGCGPIFVTNSKEDAAPSIGPCGLAQLKTIATRPIVAIGGITADNISAISQIKVAGSAVISMITNSSDIQKSVQQLIKS